MQPSPVPMVVLGKITGAFGIKGWVKVYAYTEKQDGIFAYKPWYVADGQGQWHVVKLLAGQVQGKGLVAHFDGVDGRDQAVALTGREIAVPRTQLPVLPAGEYYWSDLTGLAVVTMGGIALGVVSEFVETGANDVMVVKGERERWLPWLVGSVIQSVDMDARLIRVDWDADF